MESISLRGEGSGLVATVKGYATGAVEKLTKKSTPEDPRYYYQLQLAPSEDASEAVYAFCEREHAEQVAGAIRKAGAAVPVEATLRIGRRGINVTAVKL
jgi:hypothetical protein